MLHNKLFPIVALSGDSSGWTKKPAIPSTPSDLMNMLVVGHMHPEIGRLSVDTALEELIISDVSQLGVIAGEIDDSREPVDGLGTSSGDRELLERRTIVVHALH